MDRSIRFWGAMIVCLVMMTACGDQDKPPEAPKVVAQKIVVPANQPAAGGSAQAPSIAAPTPPAPAAAPAAPPPPPAGSPAPATPTAAPAAPVATKAPPAAPVAAVVPPAGTAAAPVAPETKQPATTAEPQPLAQVAAPAASPAASVPTTPALAKEGGAPPVAAAKTDATASLPAVEAATGKAGDAMTGAYSAEGRLDPFAPLFHAKAPAIDKTASDTSSSARTKRVAHTPLERMDISQFKLVAIIHAASGNRALVEDASGKGYVLTKGTYIGINAGIVSDIQRDKVIVEEESEDLYGRVSIQEKELKLQKPLGDM